MKAWRLIIPFVIMAALIGLHFWDQSRLFEQKVEEYIDKKVFFWKSEMAGSLKIQSEDEEIFLVNDGEKWQMLKPVNALAAQDEVSLIIRNLGVVEIESVVSEFPGDLARFGLEPPEYLVQVFDRQGGHLGVLKIGNEVPTKSFYYAMVNDEPRVFTVHSDIYSAISKSTSELRDKSVFHSKRDDILKIKVTYPERAALEAVKKGTEDWRLVTPVEATIDWDKMNIFLGKIQGLRCEEFVSESHTDFEEYGVVENATKIVFYDGKTAKSSRLIIGNYDRKAKNYYARHSNKSSILRISKSFGDSVPASAMHWRPGKPVALKPYQIREIHIEQPGIVASVVGLAKEDDGQWILIEPEHAKGTKANPEIVIDIINTLCRFDIVRYIDNHAEGSGAGLDSPTFSVSLSSGYETSQFLLSREELGSGCVYAKRTGDRDGEVFVLSRDIIGTLSRAFTDFVKDIGEVE